MMNYIIKKYINDKLTFVLSIISTNLYSRDKKVGLKLKLYQNLLKQQLNVN